MYKLGIQLINKLEAKIAPSLQLKIAGDLVQLLYTQAKFVILGSLVVATGFYYVMDLVEPTNTLLFWYIGTVIVSILRYAIVRIYFRLQPTLAKISLWNTIYILSTLAGGIVWSIAGTVLIPANLFYETSISCLLASVAAGAIPYFSGSRLACAAFVLPVLLPFALWLLTHDTVPYDDLIGFIAFFYIILLMKSSFKAHNTLYSAIKFKFENEALLNNLVSTKNKMEVMNRELRDSEEQYSLVTNALPVLISYIDTQLVYRFNNKAHEEWFGKSLSEITNHPVKDILDNAAFSLFTEYYNEFASKKQMTYETVIRFKKDDERYVSVTLIPHMKHDQLLGFFSLTSDITPRINYLATHDQLTDLPNRSLFNAQFSQAIKRAEECAGNLTLVFIDLDHFKNINDTLGHDAGDQLLIKLVNKIKGLLNSNLFARLGGDEFAIIFENITPDALVSILEKIKLSLSEPLHISNHDVFITLSMGISIYPNDGKTIQVLLKNADLALYHAKEKGRNSFAYYTAELNDKITRKQAISTRLHEALVKNELTVHYQPILNLANGHINGLEALLRWENPTLGLISPDEFIPVAEETGLISPISEWVLDTACRKILYWQKNILLPTRIKAAVNISARQFRNNKLTQIIANILSQTGLSGEHLTIELTESLIMQDVKYSAKIIYQLKAMGITIAIDDFGTGYSSLSYLRNLPIDIIKIDRTFIHDIGINQKGTAIINAIIVMAHTLKMKVIAEGVETIEQYQILHKAECDEIQGYLISSALPADQIETLLLDRDYINRQLTIHKNAEETVT